MNSQPSSTIENGLTRTATAMPRQCSFDLGERSEGDLHQHRDDHQPDQHGDRQIDLCDLGAGDGLEGRQTELAECVPNHERHPNRQRAFTAPDLAPPA